MQMINLRGLVASKYGNASGLARALGWKEKRARAIVNQGKDPSARELDELADALGITDAENFVHIFFPQVSTKWTFDKVLLTNPTDPHASPLAP